MAAPIILAFNISPEKLGKMRMLCARVKTRLRAVSESEYALTLGQLVAGEAAADKSENNADVEMCIRDRQEKKSNSVPLH